MASPAVWLGVLKLGRVGAGVGASTMACCGGCCGRGCGGGCCCVCCCGAGAACWGCGAGGVGVDSGAPALRIACNCSSVFLSSVGLVVCCVRSLSLMTFVGFFSNCLLTSLGMSRKVSSLSRCLSTSAGLMSRG